MHALTLDGYSDAGMIRPRRRPTVRAAAWSVSAEHYLVTNETGDRYLCCFGSFSWTAVRARAHAFASLAEAEEFIAGEDGWRIQPAIEQA